MKNIAIIKNRKKEVIETKKFRSYVAVERYIQNKYNNNLFDWKIDEDLIEKKPDKIDKEFGLDVSYALAKIHTIIIEEEN